jgi:transposase-like protein
LPDVTPELLDALVAGVQTSADLDARLKQLTAALSERILAAELTQHLQYPPGAVRPPGTANARNGTTPKRVLTEQGAVELAIPRDRAGTFAPQLVPKHVRRLPGFEGKVLSLYARGLTTRQLQAHLAECYQVDISPDLISTVTDAILPEVTAWQQRPLEALYVAVVFDALVVKIRDEGVVQHKAVYLALGTPVSGEKEVLGLWVAQREGAAFWQRVMVELQGRGVQDILIALIDGLTGFPEAIHAVFPHTTIHQCVVHLVRASLRYVPAHERKVLVPLLRRIYHAPSDAAGRDALATLAAHPLAARHPGIVRLWEHHWERVSPLFQYPLSVRRLVMSTNAIESLNRTLRRSLKTRGHFPTDEAATKLLYLALQHAQLQLKPPVDWRRAMQHIAILYGDRLPVAE